MRRLALLLPVAFLALSWDRVLPDRIFPPSRATVRTWDQAAPSMPGFDEGRGGAPGSPLCVVIVSHPDALHQALEEAGWTRGPSSFRDAVLSGRRWVPDRRLRGRLQDMSWTREGRILRLWRTGVSDPTAREFWWGSLDAPDRGAARDELAQALARSPRSRGLAILPAPRIPREGVDADGRPYSTDGRVAVADLR